MKHLAVRFCRAWRHVGQASVEVANLFFNSLPNLRSSSGRWSMEMDSRQGEGSEVRVRMAPFCRVSTGHIRLNIRAYLWLST
jgi:hypothetical protein